MQKRNKTFKMIYFNSQLKNKLAFVAFFILCNLGWQNVSSQVVIGTSGPVNEGALLELKENHKQGVNATKGLLLPRVALENPSLMSPVLDDDITTEDEKKQHIGLVIYNVREDYRVHLCKGVHVWTSEFNWVRIPEPCCFPISVVEIETFGLSFIEGDEAIFDAVITAPFELEDPDIEYEWFLDGVSISGRSSSDRMTFLVDMTHNGKELTVKAYNKCSVAESQPRVLTVTSQCIPIQQVDIANSLHKPDFKFSINKEVDFTPSFAPIDGSSPEYKWEFGSIISNEETFTHRVSSSGILRLTVSNDCSSVSKEVAIEVFRCDDDESKKYTMFPGDLNRPEYTFTLAELAGYTKEELKDLGVTIQWYRKRITPGHIDRTFVPIAGANDTRFVFIAADQLGSGQDIFNLGVRILGSPEAIESVMNCPPKDGYSFYRISAAYDPSGYVLAVPKFTPSAW